MHYFDPAAAIAGAADAADPKAGWFRAAGTRMVAILIARPIATVTVVAILATIALYRIPLCSDVAWQLWIAHHIRMGARLYTDIIEVNPPLWFWMAVPIDTVADLLGVEPGHVLISALALATIGSLAATERLLPQIPRLRRTALLVHGALVMLVLPAWMTGQREQILLIASLPYIALVSARRESRPVSPAFAIGIGTAAALGFALKHYFLIAPVLLEAWLIVGLRRAWRPIRPETLAIAAVGATYAAATLLLTPDFLMRVVPLLRLSYGDVGAISLSNIMQLPQYFWIGSIAVFATQRTSIGRATPFTAALLIASLAFGIAWALQHKGWAYQAIAASGTIAIAIAALMAETGRGLNAFAPAMLLCPILGGGIGDANVDGYRSVMAPLVAKMHPGESVGMISQDPGLIWPFSSEQHLRYPNRYYGYWMLYSIIDHGDRDPRLAALGHRVVDETVRDFRCIPPTRIVFARERGKSGPTTYEFFLRDPAFSDLMTHYRPEMRSAGIDVFRRVSALAPIPPSACRRGV